MAGVTDRVFPYYLPANSTVPTPGDTQNRSQYDRQLENVTSVLSRTVLPGNMLAFGSPDSAKMADLVVSAFSGGKPDALKGSQVLFIGKAEDNARVQGGGRGRRREVHVRRGKVGISRQGGGSGSGAA